MSFQSVVLDSLLPLLPGSVKWLNSYRVKRKGEYHISSFKRRGVYLILGLLIAAFIRGRRLFQKAK